MVRKVFTIFVLAIFAITGIQGALFAAEQKAAAKLAPTTAAAPVKPAAKPNFGMVAGTIVSINNTDPNNVKLEVKSDADGTIRTVTVTPWTNITKVTDVSDLRTGEPVRMMTRKVEDKDVAMGIMFGKIKKIPTPPAAKAPTAPPAPAVKAKK